MKKLLKISVPIILFVLCYFWFEPILLHNFGRKKLTDLSNLQPKINHSDPIKKQADKILKSEFDHLNTPALSVSIGIDNVLIWSNTIGYADVENLISADSLTKFRIGSTSKTFTSVGLGVLIQRKELQPQSLVEDFVPYASSGLSKLTLEQLASHTSGIRNYETCLCFPIWEYYSNDDYNSIEESISVFNNDNLLFEPGTDFGYSTYNYTLLSGMIEGASGQDFVSFMKENVFQSLQMIQTQADNMGENIENTSKFYELENGEIKEAYATNSSNKWAGGGFLSTTNDLVKFGNAVINYRLLDSTTTQLLFKPVTLVNGEVNEQNYGLGWRNDVIENIFEDKRSVNTIHHGGTAMGSTAMLILLPEYNTTVAVTMNKNGKSADLLDVAYKIAELFITSKK
ncbi:serine hydrolase domain-containing protein [Algoriphagus persicinus]|uniref:serine hydrolase domain-containing protein n=1 Tax=Algoriphagus persicinus TaxID=3108754 RepID=UPI002B366F14|nr:serine hydrolase domain-containing protein [Algoriphagus sp. E1-3-M2]MEB2786600.1 serine hydrolase domain-containing protein [Algoriphagus sp. E1-3-M2]